MRVEFLFFWTEWKKFVHVIVEHPPNKNNLLSTSLFLAEKNIEKEIRKICTREVSLALLLLKHCVIQSDLTE